MEIIEGLILKQINYKESSKIIYVYSANGLVSVLVHGSNKVKSPYLNLVRVFSHVRLIVSGKSLKTLRDGEVIDHYLNISLELNRYTYALHLMEVIYFFGNNDHDHEKLFNFILKVLDLVNQKEDYYLYIMMAELKLLFLLGIQPVLRQCVFCKKDRLVGFSIEDGGTVCEEHKNNKLFSLNTVKLLSQLYYYDLSKGLPITYQEADVKNLRILIDEFYAYHLNYQTRSRKQMKDLMGY